MRKFVLISSLFIPVLIVGATRHVYEANGAAGIQNAINMSSVYDTVFVHKGTYWVCDVAKTGIVMKDSVRLISPHPDSVTLSGLNSTHTDTAYHIIYCCFGNPLSEEAMIKGFTITNGNANGPAPHNCGGGICCVISSPVIDSCTIEDNIAENGGGSGIFIYYSSPTIINNTIRDNLANQGGGCLIHANSSPTIRDNIISGNTAQGGGGILIDSSSAVITGNVIKDNSALGVNCAGGGLLLYHVSSMTISGNVIEGNSSDEGGGIYVDSCGPDINITANVIKNNHAINYGGGFHIRRTLLTMANNIVNNNVSESDGGGIFTFESAPIIIDNIIENNSCAEYGGGLYLYHLSAPNIIRNTINNNVGDYGGGLYVEFFSSPTLTHNVITNNVSHLGGMMAICEGSRIAIDSCFVVDNGSTSDTKSGMGYIIDNADTVRINNSHLYYNTFQSDTEVNNATQITIPLENNFWWDTTEAKISSLIAGPSDFIPYEHNFISGVPGEPMSIDSVRNYDSTYSNIVDSLGNDPDILYLQIYGKDRNSNLREAAVAIIKSSIYPTGIATALIETDTNSGIYQGKVTVKLSAGNDTIRTDDMYNIVKADTGYNTIIITANMDTTQKFIVFYRCGTGIEENSRLQTTDYRLYQNYPNPFTAVTKIQWSGISEGEEISLKIYNLSGRLIKTFCVNPCSYPCQSVSWDGRDEHGNKIASGIYFYRLDVGAGSSNFYTATRKMYLTR